MTKAKALLLGFDGYETVVLVSDPPPREYLVPVWVGFFNPNDKVDTTRPHQPHRVFRLRLDTRSLEREHRWQKLSASGRSCTLEPGYVYMEVAS